MQNLMFQQKPMLRTLEASAFEPADEKPPDADAHAVRHQSNRSRPVEVNSAMGASHELSGHTLGLWTGNLSPRSLFTKRSRRTRNSLRKY